MTQHSAPSVPEKSSEKPSAEPSQKSPEEASEKSPEEASALADAYLRALETADPGAVLALFAPDATVHSPLYGPIPAADFYPRLFTHTGSSRLQLRGTASSQGRVFVWFGYDWTLSSGTPAGFECVDVLELNEDGLISTLRIFYDTAPIRPAFEAETGTSWHPDQPA